MVPSTLHLKPNLPPPRSTPLVADFPTDEFEDTITQNLRLINVTPVSFAASVTAASVRVDVAMVFTTEDDAEAAKEYIEGLDVDDAAATADAFGVPVESIEPPTITIVTTPDDDDDDDNDDKKKGLALLLLLLLLLIAVPFVYWICVKLQWGDKSGAYLQYRWSHSNPYVVAFYVPRERRVALHAKLYLKPPVPVDSVTDLSETEKEALEYARNKAAMEASEAAGGPSHAPFMDAGAGISAAAASAPGSSNVERI